jgi:hypothetical protein
MKLAIFLNFAALIIWYILVASIMDITSISIAPYLDLGFCIALTAIGAH